jgi:hypothetical protein
LSQNRFFFSSFKQKYFKIDLESMSPQMMPIPEANPATFEFTATTPAL